MTTLPSLDSLADKMILRWETRFGSPTAVTLVGSRVSRIFDLSGNGHHSDVNNNDATRPTWVSTGGPKNQPFISLPRVTDTLINTSIARPAGGRYSFFAVARVSHGSGAKFPARCGALFHVRSQEDYYSFSGLTSAGVQESCDSNRTTPYIDHSWHLFEEIYHVAGWKARLDGVDVAPNFSGGTAGVAAGEVVSVEVGLGSLSASAGEICALVIFDEELDAGALATARSYFKYWYGGPSMQGSWSWFENPRANHVVANTDSTYLGVLDSKYVNTVVGSGDVVVIQRNHTTGVTTRAVLQAGLESDEHDSPTVLVRDSDKRLLAFWNAHVGPAMYMAVSTNPEDASTWGAPVDLDPQIKDKGYTYSVPIQLLGETGDPIYLFYRGDIVTGITNGIFYSKSLDGGATWSERVLSINATSGRPYFIIKPRDSTRIDFVITNDHPAENPDVSLYHFYLEGGLYYQTDGTLIGSGPVLADDATLVYDGTAVSSWCWDLTFDGSGHPVAVFANFPTETDHRYRYARWNGSAWQTWEIVAAGTHLPFVLPFHEAPHYSGGITLDGPNAVYCSIESGGTWDVYRYVTEDGGATWALDQRITGPEDALASAYLKNIRPVVPWNGGHAEMPVVWCRGHWLDYSIYRTHVRTVDPTVLPHAVGLL